ncbi:EsaB/YukD family protein [Virgibacillus necropolis]|uniref:Ubiquitin n=1 Tax=Virgibacillus necropolis TaxID=163877 RepID=A0A221MEI1_9BACI|nr:EsaB/YukD family protein [Virgibacillus necropolis]ASN06086.1 ubiquitin [Virgibacillus necropolis]
MYIQVTVDLEHYDQKSIELRLSDQHKIKNLIDITWQTVGLTRNPREGNWIRIKNKDKVYNGPKTLAECGIITGDRVEIL